MSDLLAENQAPDQTPDQVPDHAAVATMQATDRTQRIRLGASAHTAPETLTALANDPDVTVRAAVALNTAAPSQADIFLRNDADERVRMLLARRMAGLICPDARVGAAGGKPGATQWDSRSEATLELGKRALDVLSALIADEAIRVRAAIADVLKAMPTAPRALILRLAQDSELSVSEPVLRLSPLLTERDLLTLLAVPPHGAAASTIAARADLPEAVCDAIAASADGDAIRAMLDNPTAAIRETTLDGLVTQAQTHVDWHAPLVARPALSQASARALSRIVAAQLLRTLALRPDLDPAVTQELHQRLAARLDLPGGLPPARVATGEDAVIAAAQHGNIERAMSLLAVAAGVTPGAVRRICTTRNAKALVSLTWKAGFSARSAVPMQVMLAHMPPGSLLLPRADQSFPLSDEEMAWQVSFMAERG